MQVNVPLLSDEQCESNFEPFSFREYHLCVGQVGKTMGPCNGDSGRISIN
jgi:hypothetical protein